MTKLSGYTNWLLVSGSFGLLALLFVVFPDIAWAQTITDFQTTNNFTSMVDIPGITEVDGATNTNNFDKYINALYIFAITIGAMLAVLKLVSAGVKYMFSDIVTNKESAKSDIKGAILGLLIIISAITILNTVNTDLTNVNLNIDSAGVDANDIWMDTIARIQSLIESCTQENDCTIVAMDQSECEDTVVNGIAIPGNWFPYGESEFHDRCAIVLRGPTECPDPDREVIVYTQILTGLRGVERSCVPRNQVELPTSGQEFDMNESTEILTLLETFHYKNLFISETITPKELNTAIQSCRDLAGEDSYLYIIFKTEQPDIKMLACFRSPAS